MNPTELAQQVFNRRRQMKISQTELAKMAGISRNYVSLIERGEAQNISINVLNQLAAALGTTPGELTGASLQAQTLIPPGLREFGLKAGLSFETIDRLARIPRRGREPRTAKEWEQLYQAVKSYLDE